MEGDAQSMWKRLVGKLGAHSPFSRPQRAVVPDGSAAGDALREKGWADLPPELLRSVLTRVEDSESTWPSRKHVVACAGVCRSWRAVVKELVKSPAVSGKITFPISLKQPGPRGFLVQCFIKRNQRTKTYRLYLNLNQAPNSTGKFLLVARKFRRPTCTDYIISLNAADMSKGSSSYIGKLRSSVVGARFTIYDGLPPNIEEMVAKSHSTLLGFKQVYSRVPAGNYPVAHIVYDRRSLLCPRSPMRMQCVMDLIPATAMEPGGTAPTPMEFPLHSADCLTSFSFFLAKSSLMACFFTWPLSGRKPDMLVLENKLPTWHEEFQCWTLCFRRGVTHASSKNFQLVASVDNRHSSLENEEVLQFGKLGKDLFTMYYGYPLSAFQAFAICLSAFEK